MALLFLCTANSARSQLAEAITRHLAPRLDVWSAGSEPTHVRPEVRIVLEEVGIDPRGLRSKGVDEIPLDEIELAVTLCADEVCPVLPKRVEQMHWPLPDAIRRAQGGAPRGVPRDPGFPPVRGSRKLLTSLAT